MPAPRRRPAAPRLLAGGNPRIAKAEGNAPVKAHIDAMPGWKRDVGLQIDALVERAVPGVRRAVKWNSPPYGVEGKGWFLGVHCFAGYVKVAFFKGSSLRPEPPVGSKDPHARYLHVEEGAPLDERQFTAWVKQASKLPGWDGKKGAGARDAPCALHFRRRADVSCAGALSSSEPRSRRGGPVRQGALVRAVLAAGAPAHADRVGGRHDRAEPEHRGGRPCSPGCRTYSGA